MAERTTKVRISAQIQEYVAGMEKAAQVTRETGTAAEKLAQKREAFQALGAGLTVVGGAMTALTLAVAKTGIEYNTLQQTSRAALTTLLGGAEQANAQMDKLDEFARTSPFSKSVFIQAQQQMLGFGVAAKDVIPALDSIQNAVAAMGGSNEQIKALAEIMSRVKSEGRLSGDALQRLGYYGIDAATIIGSQMGKTAVEIRDMASKPGGIPVDQIWNPLVNGLQEKFGGAADNVKETFAGAMDRVKAAWRDLSADLMTPLVDPNGGGALVDFLNWTADVMRAFEALPEPIKLTGGAFFALAGFIALVSGAILLATPKIIAMRTHFLALSATMRGIAVAGGIATLALTAVVAIVGAVSAAQAAAEQKAQSYADALEQGADAARRLTADNATAEQSFLWISRGSAADAAETLGLSLDLVAEAAAGNKDALAQVNEALDTAYAEAYTQSMKDVSGEQAAAGEASTVLRGFLDEETAAYENGTKKLEQKNEMTEKGAEASKSAASAYMDEAGSVKDLTSELTSLIDTINEANGIAGDAITANAKYQSALAGISEEVQKQRDAYEEANGTLDGFNASLDQNTESGSANASMLWDVAAASQGAAEKQLTQDLATMSADDAAKKYIGTLTDQRQKFIDAATAAGFNADEVNALAGQIYQMPSEKDVAIIVETAEAHRRIAVLQEAMNAVNSVSVILGTIPGQAAGGPVVGPGPKGVDSELRRLAPGEHVITADEVDALGGHYAVQQLRADALSGRSYGTWQQGSAQATPVVNVGAPSLDGLSIMGTFEIGGDGLGRIIDGRIIQHDAAAERVSRGRLR